MSRPSLLEFTGISRTVLEARIAVLVRLIDAVEDRLSPEDRERIHCAVRAQLDRENRP